MSSPGGGVGGGAAGTGALLGLNSAEVSGFVTKLKSRNWAATLRPLPLFAGAGQFSKPRTSAEALARLEANLSFFLTNYLAIAAAVVLITVLTQPSLLVVALLLGLLWWGASRQEEIRLPGNAVLAGRNKLVALASITGVVLFVFAGTTLFFCVGLVATIVLLHAIAHNLPPLEDGEDEQSAFGGDGAADRDFEPSPA
jgi:hypothetical protein